MDILNFVTQYKQKNLQSSIYHSELSKYSNVVILECTKYMKFNKNLLQTDANRGRFLQRNVGNAHGYIFVRIKHV